MTANEQIRFQLSDPIRDAFDTKSGDGLSVIFDLVHRSIIAYTVIVDGVLQAPGTDYTMNTETGQIVFTTAPVDGSTIKAQYTFAAFTEDEIDDVYADNNTDINKTMVCLIEVLLVDAAKRFDYTAGQTTIKQSQVFKNLRDLLKIYQDKSSNVEILDRSVEGYYKPELSKDGDTKIRSITDDLTRQDNLGNL